ncbi:MAG: hypothetical protein WCO10_03590 [bacterium]
MEEQLEINLTNQSAQPDPVVAPDPVESEDPEDNSTPPSCGIGSVPVPASEQEREVYCAQCEIGYCEKHMGEERRKK